jgi:radical SAM protein with 4Fe4S-binding SPASM domain
MDEVLRKYVERTTPLPKGFLNKIYGILSLQQGITKNCLYDNIVNREIMPCYAGSLIVHIDPEGNVYPCNFKLTDDRILGNLREEDFDTIWERKPKKILHEIKAGDCMYPNGLCGDSDIFPSIANNPPFVLKWYLNKLIKNIPLIKKIK